MDPFEFRLVLAAVAVFFLVGLYVRHAGLPLKRGWWRKGEPDLHQGGFHTHPRELSEKEFKVSSFVEDEEASVQSSGEESSADESGLGAGGAPDSKQGDSEDALLERTVDSVEGSGEGAVASLDSVEGSGEGAVASLKEAESLPQAASAAHMGLLNDPPEPFVNLFEAPLQQRGESTVDDVGVNPTDALLLLYLKPTDQGQDFPGVDVLKIAADAGMCMGERRIFHFPTEEHPQLLLLDLYKPGYLEVSDLMDKRFRGLVFVLCAPCAEDAKYLANPEQAFFDCMACINQIATLLKGTLSLKPNWAEPLDAERIDDLRHRYMKLLPSAK